MGSMAKVTASGASVSPCRSVEARERSVLPTEPCRPHDSSHDRSQLLRLVIPFDVVAAALAIGALVLTDHRTTSVLDSDR
jgi:hypothetical protein